MLSAPNRMRRSSDFSAAVRRGRRAGSRTVVVHVLVADDAQASPVIGFVVPKAVGGAVVRNRTKRRFRALVRPLVRHLIPGTLVVVRAQPAAALASPSALGNDLTRALERAGALGAATRTGGPS